MSAVFLGYVSLLNLVTRMIRQFDGEIFWNARNAPCRSPIPGPCRSLFGHGAEWVIGMADASPFTNRT